MRGTDIYPDTIFPGAGNIVNGHKNRYGAVLVAIYRFMYALEHSYSPQSQAQRDSFSCVLFAQNATVCWSSLSRRQ